MPIDFADFKLDPNVKLLGGLIEADRSFSEDVPRGVDPESFKAAMRKLAAGVVMVTARVEDRLWGLTISACTSISASPPQILISLAHGASARQAVLDTGRFGLSILHADQKSLAELGAVPGGPKYVDAFCEQSASDSRSTMIAGALYHLDCVVDRVFEVSDHTLIIGNVVTATSGTGAEDDASGPLLYFDRQFHALGEEMQ